MKFTCFSRHKLSAARQLKLFCTQVLLVGLVSIKVSDRIFEFVASRINSTLLSKAYKDAEYIDIHEVGESSLQCFCKRNLAL